MMPEQLAFPFFIGEPEPVLPRTLRILYRVAERFHESFAEGGWHFHVIPVVPGH